MKFVQSLSRRFSQEVGTLLNNLISVLHTEYEANRTQNWQKKTTLINLVITASIGNYTYRHGATDLQISSEMFE